MDRTTRHRWLLALALALATLALYAPVAGHPFIHFDDDRYLTENPVTQGGLTWFGVTWAFTTFHASNWHPLTWLSHMLDVQLFGMNAGAHHLVNAALHALDSALLFLVLARLTGATGRSLAVAALFAVHPLHVESVAWVAERKDVLSTLFGLLAVLAYARHAAAPSWRRLGLVALAFAASLLSKPMWVTLPFLLLLLDLWPLDRLARGGGAGPTSLAGLSASAPRLPLGRIVVEKLPLLALSAASSAITVAAQFKGQAIAGLEIGVGARLANALVAYARYLGKLAWPTDLSIFYPHTAGALSALAVLGAGLLLGAISALAVWQLRPRPWLAVGWCWFLGTLVPVIGLVQVGAQAMADRYAYLPSIGIFLAVVWGLVEVAGGLAGGWSLRVATATGLIALSVLTWRQQGWWQDHMTLFRHALVAGGESGLVHGVLSEGLRREGKLEEAVTEAQRAVALAPGTARHWNTLGIARKELRQHEEARAAFQEAIRLEPSYLIAWTNLSDVELLLGRPDDAIEAALQATRIAPGNAIGWHRLAQVRAATGDMAGAIQADVDAVAINPEYGAAWTHLAILYQATGRLEEAGQAFERLPRLEPGNWIGWRNLGIYHAKRGHHPEATQALREAAFLKPDDADLLHRLGLAQLGVGDKVGAMRTASDLERLDRARGADLRARLVFGP